MTYRPPPRVFVIGPPASGKTTTRDFVAEWLRKRGATVVVLGIEEAHRELLPPDGEDGSYHYDDYGALVLHARERQIPSALDLLARQSRAARAAAGFVMELAHARVGDALLSVGGELLDGALVLHLTAPLALRLRWNAQRKSSRVPEEIVRSYAERLSAEEERRIESTGASLFKLEADNLEDLRTQAAAALDVFFGPARFEGARAPRRSEL